MSIADAIAMVMVEGLRDDDNRLILGSEIVAEFPEAIDIQGVKFCLFDDQELIGGEQRHIARYFPLPTLRDLSLRTDGNASLDER